MKKRKLGPALFVCVLAMLGASPSAGFEEVSPGIHPIERKTIDDPLTISSRPELNVLLL